MAGYALTSSKNDLLFSPMVIITVGLSSWRKKMKSLDDYIGKRVLIDTLSAEPNKKMSYLGTVTGRDGSVVFLGNVERRGPEDAIWLPHVDNKGFNTSALTFETIRVIEA